MILLEQVCDKIYRGHEFRFLPLIELGVLRFINETLVIVPFLTCILAACS